MEQVIEIGPNHTLTIPEGAVFGGDNQQNTRITRLAFRNRFIFSEKVAIETAAESDPAVRVLLKDQDSASFIDLQRADTQAGVQLLASKGLITTERASEILSTVIQPSEAYSG